jgi:hypothetical protein
MDRLGKIGWIAILAAAGVLVYLLLVKPLIGMADSGDFERIIRTAGLDYLDPAAPYKDQFFSYMHTKFAFSDKWAGGYISTELIIVYIAVLINKIVHPSVFDIRFLSVLYILLMLTTFALGLKLKLLSTRTSKISFAVCFLIIFLDVGYSAYFNSFYGEPIALIFLLLTLVLALRLTEQDRPTWIVYTAFAVAAIFVAGSKVQYAPAGIILCLLSFRFMRLSSQRSWRRGVAIWSALLLLFSVGIYMTAPKELRVINQYQSVFYGILKDSPTPEQDLRDLGLDPKLAVLANTNYFTPNTPIPQQSEELKRDFYSHISHGKIAMFYVKHPARYWNKLQVTAHNAMNLRPSYLGNYEKAEGLEPGKISSTYSTWSSFKNHVLPHTLWFIGIIYIMYYLVLFVLYLNQYNVHRKKHSYEVFAVIPIIGASAFFVPLIGDGEADMEKHLFLFNVCFDLMFVVCLVWLIHQSVKMVRGRVS